MGIRFSNHGAGELVALKACAESAGMAMACDFASSSEYEAELIAARRAEGRYGHTARFKQQLVAAAAIASALAVLLLAFG
jgi:hypothetical protein